MCRNGANDEVVHLLKLVASASTLATHLLLAPSPIKLDYIRVLHSLAVQTEKFKPKRSVCLKDVRVRVYRVSRFSLAGFALGNYRATDRSQTAF